MVVHSAIKLAKKNCNLGSHESMALKFNSGTTMFEKKAKKVDFHLWAIIVCMLHFFSNNSPLLTYVFVYFLRLKYISEIFQM